jgi:hypothetical protein
MYISLSFVLNFDVTVPVATKITLEMAHDISRSLLL